MDWTDIPDSGPGEANATRYTVTGLDNAVEYSFELRARDAGAGKSDAATVRVTPTGPPRILSVEVTSVPGLDGDTYGAGEEVDISVTFDQPVVVEGAPQLALDVGGSRLAEYHEGNGSKTLVFVYVVTESDRDTDGVSVGEDALRLNGGRIGNGAGDDAELDHEGLGQQSGHMVDGGRRAGVHDHGEFTHSHSHSRQQYPEHTHEGHEHPDEANGHKRRPGTHVHHAQEDLNAEISGGPDVRTHDGVEHIHRCFDLKPSCNQGDDYSRAGRRAGAADRGDPFPRALRAGPPLRLAGVLRGRRVRRDGVGGGRGGGARRGPHAGLRGEPGAGGGVRGAGGLRDGGRHGDRGRGLPGRRRACWRSRPGRRAGRCRCGCRRTGRGTARNCSN